MLNLMNARELERLLTVIVALQVNFKSYTSYKFFSRYPKPTMDLIKNLSKDFADDMKRLLNFWPRKVIVTDSNTGGAKDNGIYCKFIYINNFILNN